MPISTDTSAIQIRVDDISQLFNTLDPFPFRERDLDREAEEFIVGWGRELPKDAPIRIVIHVPHGHASTEKSADVAEALHRYFRYRAELSRLELNELFRIGRVSLLIGVGVFALCFLTAGALAKLADSVQLRRVSEEGLIILGWVANWKPIEIFLYDWWPIMQRRKLYARLSQARVELRPEEAP